MMLVMLMVAPYSDVLSQWKLPDLSTLAKSSPVRMASGMAFPVSFNFNKAQMGDGVVLESQFLKRCGKGVLVTLLRTHF